MAAMRRRNLVSSRRRLEDEGEEDDDGPLSPGDDSASEASILSDAEDNLQVDDSDLSDTGDAGSPELLERRPVTKESGETAPRTVDNSTEKAPETEPQHGAERATNATFLNTADTDAMLHGLKPDQDVDAVEDLTFEGSVDNGTPAKAKSIQEPQKDAGIAKRESMYQRRMRESQEYNSKRESDPAFVPTRGGFFMHDHRNDAFAQSAFMPFGRGRGRGKDITSNPHSSFRPSTQPADPSRGRWDHDLHDAITNVKPVVEQRQPPKQELLPAQPLPQGNTVHTSSPSKSVPLGVVMVKVALPFSDKPVKAFKMTFYQYTRLPDLRPPLRRDKPVRVSLPDLSPRYIFPSPDRSFVFIPRAQRPNQQQATKTKTRTFVNQPGSRRTSGYGDSGYEPSVTLSRRSSVARDALISPHVSIVGNLLQPPHGSQARPVVKLPSGSKQEHELPTSADNAVPSIPSEPYDLPSQPTYRENAPNQLTMHQPRPQKNVSVATIESPDNIPLHAPQQQAQQPFHHQVPTHINGPMSNDAMNGMAGGHLSMGGPPSARSMSSANILEGAINAQPFQPSVVSTQGVYTAPYPAQSIYYYPAQSDAPPDQYTGDGVTTSVFVQQGSYLVPMFVPPSIPGDEVAGAPQAGMYAQERNGMVYYYDSSLLMHGADEVAPANYPVPGAGNMMPPGSDAYYYTPAPTNVAYYPT